jgi:hypothetical protein
MNPMRTRGRGDLRVGDQVARGGQDLCDTGFVIGTEIA